MRPSVCSRIDYSLRNRGSFHRRVLGLVVRLSGGPGNYNHGLGKEVLNPDPFTGQTDRANPQGHGVSLVRIWVLVFTYKCTNT